MIFAVLTGTLGDFYNVILKRSELFCSCCGGLIGSISGESVMIRSQRLIRVDPRFLVSVCIGDTKDKGDHDVSHEHLPHVLMVENTLTSPILPMGFQSVQNGHILTEPCPFSLNIFPSIPSARDIHSLFSLSGPLPSRLRDLITGNNRAEHTTGVSRAVSIGSENIVSVAQSPTTPAPIKTADAPETINESDANNTEVQENVVLNTSVPSVPSSVNTVDDVRDKIIQHLRAKMARSYNNERNASPVTYVFEPISTQIANANAAENVLVQSEMDLTSDPFAPIPSDVANTTTAETILSQSENVPISNTGDFVPMRPEDFDAYLQQQPSTSTDVYEPPVKKMMIQQRAYELASFPSVSARNYMPSVSLN